MNIFANNALDSIKSIDDFIAESEVNVALTLNDIYDKTTLMQEHATEEYNENEFYQESVLAGALIGGGIISVIAAAIALFSKVLKKEATTGSSSDSKNASTNSDEELELLPGKNCEKSVEKLQKILAKNDNKVKMKSKLNIETVESLVKQSNSLTEILAGIVKDPTNPNALSSITAGGFVENFKKIKVVEKVQEYDFTTEDLSEFENASKFFEQLDNNINTAQKHIDAAVAKLKKPANNEANNEQVDDNKNDTASVEKTLQEVTNAMIKCNYDALQQIKEHFRTISKNAKAEIKEAEKSKPNVSETATENTEQNPPPAADDQDIQAENTAVTKLVNSLHIPENEAQGIVSNYDNFDIDDQSWIDNLSELQRTDAARYNAITDILVNDLHKVTADQLQNAMQPSAEQQQQQQQQTRSLDTDTETRIQSVATQFINKQENAVTKKQRGANGAITDVSNGPVIKYNATEAAADLENVILAMNSGESTSNAIENAYNKTDYEHALLLNALLHTKEAAGLGIKPNDIPNVPATLIDNNPGKTFEPKPFDWSNIDLATNEIKNAGNDPAAIKQAAMAAAQNITASTTQVNVLNQKQIDSINNFVAACNAITDKAAVGNEIGSLLNAVNASLKSAKKEYQNREMAAQNQGYTAETNVGAISDALTDASNVLIDAAKIFNPSPAPVPNPADNEDQDTPLDEKLKLSIVSQHPAIFNGMSQKDIEKKIKEDIAKGTNIYGEITTASRAGNTDEVNYWTSIGYAAGLDQQYLKNANVGKSVQPPAPKQGPQPIKMPNIAKLIDGLKGYNKNPAKNANAIKQKIAVISAECSNPSFDLSIDDGSIHKYVSGIANALSKIVNNTKYMSELDSIDGLNFAAVITFIGTNICETLVNIDKSILPENTAARSELARLSDIVNNASSLLTSQNGNQQQVQQQVQQQDTEQQTSDAENIQQKLSRLNLGSDNEQEQSTAINGDVFSTNEEMTEFFNGLAAHGLKYDTLSDGKKNIVNGYISRLNDAYKNNTIGEELGKIYNEIMEQMFPQSPNVSIKNIHTEMYIPYIISLEIIKKATGSYDNATNLIGELPNEGYVMQKYTVYQQNNERNAPKFGDEYTNTFDRVTKDQPKQLDNGAESKILSPVNPQQSVQPVVQSAEPAPVQQPQTQSSPVTPEEKLRNFDESMKSQLPSDVLNKWVALDQDAKQDILTYVEKMFNDPNVDNFDIRNSIVRMINNRYVPPKTEVEDQQTINQPAQQVAPFRTVEDYNNDKPVLQGKKNGFTRFGEAIGNILPFNRNKEIKEADVSFIDRLEPDGTYVMSESYLFTFEDGTTETVILES